MPLNTTKTNVYGGIANKKLNFSDTDYEQSW